MQKKNLWRSNRCTQFFGAFGVRLHQDACDSKRNRILDLTANAVIRHSIYRSRRDWCGVKGRWPVVVHWTCCPRAGADGDWSTGHHAAIFGDKGWKFCWSWMVWRISSAMYHCLSCLEKQNPQERQERRSELIGNISCAGVFVLLSHQDCVGPRTNLNLLS